MARAVLCPSCKKAVALPAEGGGSIPCPACGTAVPVPSASEEAEAIQVELAEPPPAPRRQRPPASTCPDCGDDVPAFADRCPGIR
jgi:hypothetical protein